MLSLASLFQKHRGLKSLLVCLILCGIRVSLRGVKGPAFSSFTKRILRLCFRRSSALPPDRDLKTFPDEPYTLNCSTLPDPMGPAIAQPSGRSAQIVSASVSLGRPANHAIHVSPSGSLSASTVGPLTAPPHHCPSNHFTVRLPAPFKELCPITAAQLAPRRHPISQTGPIYDCNQYTNPALSAQRASEGRISPYTQDFTPDNNINFPEWRTFLHPQGSLYHYHARKKVLTNANILNEDNRNVVVEIADQLFEKLAYDNAKIPDDLQLVIDVMRDNSKIGYYFATLGGRCLFWTEEYNMWRVFAHAERHVRSFSHLRHLIEVEFWRHYQLFPHAQVLDPKMVKEIRGFLLFTATEHIFNINANSEYSAGEVEKALNVINSLPGHLIGEDEATTGYYAWIIGSIMSFNALHRFHNHHGQPNVRWRRDDFLYTSSYDPPPALYQVFSFLLFYTPETYYQSLRHILSDGDVSFEAWKAFVPELHQEWNGLTLIGTVLLATNVAFLAIPSLDNGDHPDQRSVVQVLSYLSIITSICSVILGQSLSRFHRIKGWEYLDARITENFDLLLELGCNQLAVAYSLPYALLIWSLALFLVAFLAMCFKDTLLPVRLSIGIPSAVVALAIGFYVYKMWAGDEVTAV